MGKDCEPRVKIEHEELASVELKKKKEMNFRHMERTILLYKVKKALKGFR